MAKPAGISPAELLGLPPRWATYAATACRISVDVAPGLCSTASFNCCAYSAWELFIGHSALQSVSNMDQGSNRSCGFLWSSLYVLVFYHSVPVPVQCMSSRYWEQFIPLHRLLLQQTYY